MQAVREPKIIIAALGSGPNCSVVTEDENETALFIAAEDDSPLLQRTASRRRVWRCVNVAALAAIGLTMAAMAGVSSAMATARQEAGEEGLGDSLVGLWYSGGLRSMRIDVLERLWKTERMLVKSGLCPATDKVSTLRAQPWPRPDAGKAPTIGKMMYINLAWDNKRMDYMEEQLTELSGTAWEAEQPRLIWERFEAIEAKALEHEDRYAFWRKKGFSQARSPDVRGDWSTAACAFSHYMAISQIPETPGSDLVIIMEDDVELSPDIFQLWEDLWPFVPPEWDVLRVGWFSDHQNCSEVVNEKVDRAGWQDPRNGECAYCGAQAYIVNPESKERVLKRFELSRITHADELLGAPTPQLEDPALVPEIRAYVVMPMLAKIHFKHDSPAFSSDRIALQKEKP